MYLLQVWSDVNCDVLLPISQRLACYLRELLSLCPDNFIATDNWPLHLSTLRGCTINEHDCMKVLDELIQRNGSLELPSNGIATHYCKILDLLDNIWLRGSSGDNYAEIFSPIEDDFHAVKTILCWTTSRHRLGLEKAHIASQVLRATCPSADRLTQIILDLLQDQDFAVDNDKKSFFLLMAELTLSGYFSITLYLRWLLARGGIRAPKQISIDGPCATRLLIELPRHSFSDDALRLQSSMLHRINHTLQSDQFGIETCLDLITTHWQTLTSKTSLAEATCFVLPDTITEQLVRLNRAGKSHVARWLKTKCLSSPSWHAEITTSLWDSAPQDVLKSLATQEFVLARYILESLDEHVILSEVLLHAMTSTDVQLLASCCDTVLLHMELFSALHILERLVELLFRRLRFPQDTSSVNNMLLMQSLQDLSFELARSTILCAHLLPDIKTHDSSMCFAARSPVSDHMVPVVTGIDFVDEMEAVLGTGTTIDVALGSRLFHQIISQPRHDLSTVVRKYACHEVLLLRLKMLDPSNFDKLISAWLVDLFKRVERPESADYLCRLVCYHCLDIKRVLAVFMDHRHPDTAGNPMGYWVGLEIFQLLFGTEIGQLSNVVETYRFLAKRSRAYQHCQKDVLVVLRSIMMDLNFARPSTDPQSPATALWRHPGLSHALRKFALQNAEQVCDFFLVPLCAVENTRMVAAAILENISKPGLHSLSVTKATLGSILREATGLSIPFCKLQLAVLFASNTGYNMTEEDETKASTKDMIIVLDQFINDAIESSKTTWTRLLPLLGTPISDHILNQVQARLLTMVVNEDLANDDLVIEKLASKASSLLRIVAAASSSAIPSRQRLRLELSELASTLKKVMQRLSNFRHEGRPLLATMIQGQLPWLLDLLNTSLRTGHANFTKPELEQQALILTDLVALYLDLQALCGTSKAIHDLAQRTFDLALKVVDMMPDDVRQACFLQSQLGITDPRLRYLYSYVNDHSNYLKLQIGSTQVVPRPSTAVVRDNETLSQFPLKRWEMLGEPGPNVGDNDTSLSLTLFEARKT